MNELGQNKPDEKSPASPIALSDLISSLPNSQAAKFNLTIEHLVKVLQSASCQLAELRGSEMQTLPKNLYSLPESNLIEYVRSLTFEAASDVMKCVEAASPTLKRMEARIAEIAEPVSEPNTGQIHKHAHTQNLLVEQKNDVANLVILQQRIFELQSFQDLTSQAVTRAQAAILEVENTLTDLTASLTVSQSTGFAPNEKTQEPTSQANLAKPQQPQLSQLEADSVLSKLGF